MARKPTKATNPKRGKIAAPISIAALPIRQGKTTLVVFTMPATELWTIASINRRDRNKDSGYQRVLPQSRVTAISKYIQSGWNIPNAIVVALDGAKFDVSTNMLTIPAGEDVAWVIDGQHRLAGAHEAMMGKPKENYDFPVVAFLDIEPEQQIEQFITINREAKGVPASLVLDLLDKMPRKNPSDAANERAADLAKELDRDETSPFYNRVVIDRPQGRQLSLVNFVRKTAPLVHTERGRLRSFSLEQQKQILLNYFLAIREVYNVEWEKRDSIFFKTIGFGAMMNIFESIFNSVTEQKGAFRVKDVTELLDLVADFEFEQWSAHGTGTKAESEAAKDFSIDLERATARMLKKTGAEKIRLI